MADVTYEVNHYIVSLAGRPTPASGARAQIVLTSLSQAGVAARLYFYSPDVADTKADTLATNGMISMHLSVTELDFVIDLLRHEKPIWITWYGYAGRASLSTSSEPVGEDEA